MLTRWLKQRSRLAQCLVAVLILIVCLLGGLEAIVSYGPKVVHAQTQWRSTIRAKLAVAKAWAQQEEAVTQRAVKLDAAPVWQQFYVSSKANSVGTQVERHMATLLNSVGVTTVAFDGTISSQLGSIRVDGVKLTASLTADQLRLICAGLHSHVPYLRLQRLQVSAPLIEASYENPTLTVNMEIVGFSTDSARAVEKST